ncbi:MAG: hypothetical protein IJW44_00125 [Clostridia bacterium]|nr:hypothetical protein [Clostridia bacterium]
MKQYVTPFANLLLLSGSDVLLSSGEPTGEMATPDGFADSTPTITAAPTSWWE